MIVLFKHEEEETKVEHALFFVNGEHVFLLHAVGVYIEGDLDAGLVREGEAGPWAEIPKQDGLWIWEGTPGWYRSSNPEYDDGGEPSYEKRGTARRPSEAECKIILNGPIDELFGPSRWPPSSEESK